jgi:hypothetical protein
MSIRAMFAALHHVNDYGSLVRLLVLTYERDRTLLGMLDGDNRL